MPMDTHIEVISPYHY